MKGSHVLLRVLGGLGPVATITEHIRTTAILEPPSLKFVAGDGHPWVCKLLILHRGKMNIGFGGSSCLPDRPVHRDRLLHEVFKAE